MELVDTIALKVITKKCAGSSPVTSIFLLCMAHVAEWYRRQFVVLFYVGSNPIMRHYLF